MQGKLRIIFLVLALALPWTGTKSFAQFFSLGQDPSSGKWLNIKTEHFNIIFSDSFANPSKQLAKSLESAYPLVNNSMGARTGRIPLIIHNQGVISNAVVSWAPKRMEFFTTPPQDMYAQDWLDQLVLHELRHVMQISRTKVGISKMLPWIFGEQITAGITGLFIPSWLLEGDAVVSETALSQSGRGRTPSFEMLLRAQLMEKGIYSYDKAVLGSYKTFVPNEYVLGYHLVAMGRMQSGALMWQKVIDYTGRRPFLIMPFSYGIRKQSGLGKIRFYHKSLGNLREIYGKSETRNTTGKHTRYLSYRFPQQVNDSVVFAMKSSLDDIERFVLIEDGKERPFFSPGQIFEDRVSLSGNKIYWSEIQEDTRWEQRNYAVIKSFDFVQKKLLTLTHKTRYFAPAVSSDGLQLCVVETKEDYSKNLVLLDAETGNSLLTTMIPDSLFVQMPSFSAESGFILAVITGKSGKTIGLINMRTGNIQQLLPYTFHDLSRPVQVREMVYFIASFGGINNIFALNLEKYEVLQVSDVAYGVNDFSVNAFTILFSEYTSDGFKVSRLPNQPANWTKPRSFEYSKSGLDTIIAAQEQILASNIPSGSTTTKTLSDSTLTFEHFSKFRNLFNFHSWAPFYMEIDNQTFNPGISLMSQDLLSTSFLSAGYEYLRGENTGRTHLTYSYEGFFPKISLQYLGGKRKSSYYSTSDKRYKEFSWTENQIKTGISLPINLSKNNIYKGLRLSLNSTYYDVSTKESQLKNFFTGNFTSLDYRLYYYHYLKSPAKNMYPTFGFTLSSEYKHTPFSGTDLGDISYGGLQVFWPGFLKHQGGRVIFAWQKRNPNGYTFSNLSLIAPGFSGYTGNEYKLFYADYKFPIWYPDLSLPGILYIKRLTGTAFYADSELSYDKANASYTSYGFEVASEFHLFRFYAPIDLGIRRIYSPHDAQWFTEIVYQVSFEQFKGKDKFRRIGRGKT